MKTSDRRQHCPEVENLMEGRMPFITRYGITLVVLVILAFVAILFFTEGTPHQLTKDMMEHTVEQMKSKI